VLAGPEALATVDDPPAPALRAAFAAVGVEGPEGVEEGG
jgi:hypothetical protein